MLEIPDRRSHRTKSGSHLMLSICFCPNQAHEIPQEAVLNRLRRLLNFPNGRILDLQQSQDGVSHCPRLLGQRLLKAIQAIPRARW
jgi:hypothetical protein